MSRQNYNVIVSRERHAKKHWWRATKDESSQLTDEDIDRFVQSLLPLLLTCMYANRYFGPAAITFRELAALRPDMVIPPVIDRYCKIVVSASGGGGFET